MPLGAIATVEQVDVQGSITRIDQAPAASITAEITERGHRRGVARRSRPRIDALKADGRASRPASTSELAGVTQQQNEAFGGLFASMGVAILLVYVMMVLTFNSLVTPFIILFSLPLATIGAFPALYVTGRPIGVSALIGFLMLIGIVVTNAIVLLDLVERLRREGHSTHDALIEGGRTRVRPILMTAIATILALDPARRGLQPGLDHRRRARHGRHRRPVQLDVPDPARDPGRLLARRRAEASRRGVGARAAGGHGGGNAGRLILAAGVMPRRSGSYPASAPAGCAAATSADGSASAPSPTS